jgi:hypothetical protein
METNLPPSPSRSASTSSLSSSLHNASLENDDETSASGNQRDLVTKDKGDDDLPQEADHGQTSLQHQQPYSATSGTTVDTQQTSSQQTIKEQDTDQTLSQGDDDDLQENKSPTTPHIPAKKFAPLLISLLLDQNSNLASLGQQCIVSVATDLASSAPDSERGVLDRYLLDTEIFDGVITGLMDIVHGRTRHEDKTDDDEHLSANLSATSIDNNTSKETPAVGIMRRPSATPGFEPSSVADDSTQGEINLAKMTCLSVRHIYIYIYRTNHHRAH